MSTIFLLSSFVYLQAVGLLFFVFGLICLFISGNEVSWVLLLGECFSTSLLKEKEVKEYAILFQLLCFLFFFPPHSLLTDLEEASLLLWRVLSLC